MTGAAASSWGEFPPLSNRYAVARLPILGRKPAQLRYSVRPCFNGRALVSSKPQAFAEMPPTVDTVRVASQIDEGVIVTIVCDGGWKYLSTGAWTDDLDQVTERAKRIIYF